jgi:flagellar motor switch protein FliG
MTVAPAHATPPLRLTGRQKAAILVRVLMAQGADLPIASLPDDLQAALAEQIASMRLVDRETLRSVIAEFSALLDSVGVTFPAGIDDTLSLLEGRITPGARGVLRRRAGEQADPWPRLASIPDERLRPVIAAESLEVGAIILSKLPVAKAAGLLSSLPGDRARRIATTMAQTTAAAPALVQTIGQTLLDQLDLVPEKAFATPPEERVGAILNATTAAIRDEILAGIETDDAEFARQVRRAIFTFADIPARLAGRDVAKAIRGIDQARLVTALAGASGPDAAAAEFLLANLSQRMAAALREEMAERGQPRSRDAEAAQAELVSAILALAETKEITLVQPETAEDAA